MITIIILCKSMKEGNMFNLEKEFNEDNYLILKFSNKIYCHILKDEEKYLIDVLTKYAKENDITLYLLDEKTVKHIINLGLKCYNKELLEGGKDV